MYAVMSRSTTKPPSPDWTLTQIVVVALCIGVFVAIARGCGSTAHAPEPRYELVPDHFPNFNIARSK